MNISTLRPGIAAGIAAAALALACGAQGADGLGGTIRIDGSSTVFPITEAVAEEFGKVQPRTRVNVGVSGTGGGLQRFVIGNIDISNASRPIKQSELDAAAEHGVDYLELSIAMDGLTVMVNPANDFVSCLTVDELERIWEPGSTVSTWDQVRPEFPDRPIHLYGPDTDSGTFDYFTETVMGESAASRADYTASADDNVLVQGISGDRNSLGYFGYAYYAANPDKMKAVAVDGGTGCVSPSEGSIESGEYTPLSRPLLIYVNLASLGRPEVAAFVEFYIEQGAALALEVGYVPLPPEVYEANLAAVRKAVTP